MRKCPFCQAELEDGAVFCGECGARLDGETPQTAEPTAEEAPAQAEPEQNTPEQPQSMPAPESPAYEPVFCPNCGMQAEPGTAFCSNCGTPLQEADTAGPGESVFCPNCGMQAEPGTIFCSNCGTPLQEADAAGGKPKKAKRRGKLLPVLLAAVAAAMAAALFLLLRSGTGSGKPAALYIKDEEIFYRDFSQKEPLEVTERLIKGGDDDSLVNTFHDASVCAYNKSKTRLFFPDKVDFEEESAELYYRDVNKPKKEAERIDTDIREYAINSAGTKIVYLKGENGVLYSSDLKDKEKIASGVNYFAITEDAKKVLYRTAEGDLYLWQNGEKDKLASDASYIRTTDDLSTVYYLRDSDFYCLKTASGDAAKIASDVYDVKRIYPDTGEVFYTKGDTVTCNASDYVVDDMAAADAALTEPKYPSWFDYDSDTEYERAYEAYEQASEEYYAKLSRDHMRDDLKDTTFEISQYTLYYYNGTDSEKVSENIVDIWDYSCAGDTAAVAFKAYSPEEVPSVRLSELESVYEIEYQAEEAQRASAQCYVYAGGEMMPVEGNKAQSPLLSADGRTLYFMDDVDNGSVGDLYRAGIRNGSVEAPELMDTEVYTSLQFIGGKLRYYKNYDSLNNRGDLYIDGKEVDYDVRGYNLYADDDRMLYYTDWNDDKKYGTLMLYENNKSTKVADDVHDCLFAGDEILYLKDYSARSLRGTLERYNNGKPQKLDEDVAVLLREEDRIGGAHYLQSW